MQYHLNGFRPGDPELHDAAPDRSSLWDLPAQMDVLIVGCGPAGLTLAAYLSKFPDISTRIVERRAGPLEKGQADGISCRSMEMFNTFGFAETVMKQGHWVNETTFWKPDPDQPGHIARTGRVQDVEDGLSEMPHIVLNQARVHDMYLDVMRKSPSRLEPDYGLQFAGCHVDTDHTHPVAVTLERVVDGAPTGDRVNVRARYVVGCDGARSAVRHAIGQKLNGDSAHQAWGVMDVLAFTDFPDIRNKCLIQSAQEGNIIVIPREGGYLIRLYVEIDALDVGERVSSRNIGLDQLVAAAQRTFRPYDLDIREVVWWSVYEIGQRLCDRFDDGAAKGVDDQPHVFIAGDACHTHSPKAGQGMNVSMGDAFNLGWKLVSVLQGRSTPDLLRTYTCERQAVARDLIDFDRDWAKIMNARPKTNAGDATEPPEFQRYFIEHGRYTAGMSVTYAPSVLTGRPGWQGLATGFGIGTRFHSAPVKRLSDVKPVELGHSILADARWRLFAFAPSQDPGADGSALHVLCTFLANDPASPLRRHTPQGADPDCVIDVMAVLQQDCRAVALETLPELLMPIKGKLGLRDYEKVFCADPVQDIFDLRGIDRENGCLVVVRPDQYVANVLPLDGHAALSEFFAQILCPAERMGFDASAHSP